MAQCLKSCVTLGKLLPLSEPGFIYLRSVNYSGIPTVLVGCQASGMGDGPWEASS